MTLADWLTQRFPDSKRTTLRRMVEDRRVLVGGKPATRFNAPLTGTEVVEVRDREPARPNIRTSRDALRDITTTPASPGRDHVPTVTPPNARDPSSQGGKSEPRSQHRASRPSSATRGHNSRRGRGEREPDEATRGALAQAGVTLLHEDDDLLVVVKPAGLLTSTVPREPRPTLWAMLCDDVAGRDPRAKVGLVHRLDRDASGLLVFSKNMATYDSLKSQFFHHNVERVYHAVVRGHPKPAAGRIESRLVERADGVVYSTKQPGRGDRAVTDYSTVRAAKRLSLVRVTLHTGRKHQIRVHLSQRNWSILGDSVYGHGEMTPPETGLMLTATRLGFTHPRTGEPVAFEIPIPAEMEALVPK